MKIKVAYKRFEKLISDHAPAILTSVGIAGTAVTAVLTAKATVKAVDLMNEEDVREAPTKDKALLVWKLYIPAVSSGIITCSATFMSNRISMKRAAAIASALSLTDRAYSEYREKVQEVLGAPKEDKIRAAVADDRIKANPHRGVVPEELQLFFDMWSGQYFYSTMQDVRAAINDTNYQALHYQYATLSDFYNAIGVRPTQNSDDIGWSADSLLKVKFSTVSSEDGRACHAISFDVAPTGSCFSAN